MKLLDTYHARTFQVTNGLPPAEPPLDIEVTYPGDASVTKGILLDAQVLPQIQRAVNCHDELLAACQEAFDELSSINQNQELIDALDWVISKCQGFKERSLLKKVDIGTVEIFCDPPESDNPYRSMQQQLGLNGRERAAALMRFKHDMGRGGLHFWYAPVSGGCCREIHDPSEINWLTSMVP